MVRKILGALIGAVALGALLPVGCLLLLDQPFRHGPLLLSLLAVGLLLGLLVGWMFPRFFTFFLEALLSDS